MIQRYRIGLFWLNFKAGEGRYYCLNIHLDVPNGGREHEWRGTVVNVWTKIDAGGKEGQVILSRLYWVRSWGKMVRVRPPKTESNFLSVWVDYYSILWYDWTNWVGRNYSKSYKTMECINQNNFEKLNSWQEIFSTTKLIVTKRHKY